MGRSKWKQEMLKMRLEENRPWDEIIDKYELVRWPFRYGSWRFTPDIGTI